VTTERPDRRVGQQSIELSISAGARAKRLDEQDRVGDPPDHERAGDHVLLVTRQHFGVAGFIDPPAHVERDGLVDRPWQLPVKPGRGRRAQRTAETSDENGLSFRNHDRHRLKENRDDCDRTNGGSQAGLHVHGFTHSSPPSR
jgi:hypothetical protein